jgi:hypothetical protein
LGLIVDGATINLGSIKGGNWISAKNNDFVWNVNDKNGEAITSFKEVAYVGGRRPIDVRLILDVDTFQFDYSDNNSHTFCRKVQLKYS